MIALITTDGVGGAFDYTLALSRELTARRFEVHLATMGPALRPRQRAAALAIGGVALHESTFALEWMDEPWDDVASAADWLLSLERWIHPHVVQSNGFAHAAAGFDAPVVVVGHSCVLSWWEAVHRAAAPARYDRYRIAVRRGLAAASAVVAPSAAMLASLKAHYGPLAAPAVVPNGIDIQSVDDPVKEALVFSAGRVWDPAKNLAAMSRIAPRLAWPVAVAGELEAPSGVPTALPDVVSYGWLPPNEVGRLMDRAAIFASPSRYEPFGLAALEAAVRGCALVLGDIPSLREIWDDAALFVDPEDDNAIAAGIEQLIATPNHRAALVLRSRARAAAMTAARMADGMIEVYARATATNKPAGPARFQYEPRA
jgi:glycosyltransferase involved in cell wall biosynthesis